MTKEECAQKVKELNDKVNMAETKAKDFAIIYLKRNPQFSKYKSAIHANLKKYFYNNPTGIPEFSVLPLSQKMCRIKFIDKKKSM